VDRQRRLAPIVPNNRNEQRLSKIAHLLMRESSRKKTFSITFCINFHGAYCITKFNDDVRQWAIALAFLEL